MKVLVLAPYLPHPPDHGGRIRSDVLLQALARSCEVHLLAPLPGPRQAADAWAAARGIALHDLPAVVPPRTSPWRKLRCWARGCSELLERRWSVASRARVLALLQQQAFDLVVADSSYVLPLLPASSPPLVLHLHNVEAAMFARRDAVARSLLERCTRRIEARRIAAAEAAAAARALLVITVSALDRRRILALAPAASVHCVPNSIDLDRLPQLPPRPPGAPVRLLFVGSFDYPPNLEAARELVQQHLPMLRAQFPGLTVRLVGRDDVGALRPLAAVGVEAIGYADDLLPHYRDCDAVYLPIRSGGGTRIKVLEAFALGRPVLSTQVAVEGLGLLDGRDYLGFETPAQGVAAVQQVLAGKAASVVAAARALVVQQWSHAAAIEQLRVPLAALPLRTAATATAGSTVSPLESLCRGSTQWIGRPLGVLYLWLWRLLAAGDKA